MYRSNLTSALLQDAVDELSSLPGIGKKSALRFALHLMRQPGENVERFSKSILRMRNEIKYCNECNMISDSDICPVCSSPLRERALVCVVESIRDVISIENTGQYNGLYHVLGGIISPMDGRGPSDLSIDHLISRVSSGLVSEVFLALSTTMEGETTAYYLFKKLNHFDIKISTIARGVGFGDDLEYTDEVTLGRSIQNRQPFVPLSK